jgi:hypothetical protein
MDWEFHAGAIMSDGNASEICYRFSALDPNSVLLLLQATFRSRTLLKNIMFKGERIAYEVSMNDIYAANDPVGGNVSYYFCHVVALLLRCNFSFVI